MDARLVGGQYISSIPLKVNTAGVMPIIFASVDYVMLPLNHHVGCLGKIRWKRYWQVQS
ncbi:hypothetical protein [Eubacterium ramulus]|uniref:hypothetical protein n=1 Tax=Eubacterium ramulus TaxID=39490 RepID=UPI003520D6BF